MSSVAVQDILRRIERLSDEDRLNLAMRLAEQEEADWQREAEQARQAARDKGITQGVIDQSVNELRRGK